MDPRWTAPASHGMKKTHMQKKNADERNRRHRPVFGQMQGSFRNPQQGLDDDNDDCRLDSEEQCIYEWHIAVQSVD